jgi:hypothetical protein
MVHSVGWIDSIKAFSTFDNRSIKREYLQDQEPIGFIQ